MKLLCSGSILVALTSIGVACNGSGTGIVPPPPSGTSPAAIRFSVDTLRLAQGDAQTVTVTVLDTQNREIAGANPVLTWVAGKGVSLTIDGRSITGGGAGRAVLTAKLGSVTADLQVLVFGHPGTNPERLLLGARPYGVAVGDNFALVTQLDGGTVTRFSLFPFAVTNTISTGSLASVPTGISIDRTGTRALVANQWDPSVGIIDLASNQQTSKITTTSTTFRTAFSADGTRGYATLSGGAMMVIDPAAGTSVITIPIVQAGNGIAFGRGDTLVYLSSMYGSISVFSTKTNTVVSTLQLMGTLQDIIASPDGSSLFVASETSPSIAIVSTASGTVTGMIPLGGPAFGMALSPDGKQIWVTQTSGSVIVIDAATRAVVKTIVLGGVPRRIGFDRFGSVAVVSDEAGSVVLIH